MTPVEQEIEAMRLACYQISRGSNPSRSGRQELCRTACRWTAHMMGSTVAHTWKPEGQRQHELSTHQLWIWVCCQCAVNDGFSHLQLCRLVKTGDVPRKCRSWEKKMGDDPDHRLATWAVIQEVAKQLSINLQTGLQDHADNPIVHSI